MDKPVHADLVFDLRLVEEVLQGLTRTGLDGIEGRLELTEVGRDFDRSIIKPNGIGRVEAHQVELLGYIATELFEIRFKDVGHPVPTRPHVEREPFGFKTRARPPAWSWRSSKSTWWPSSASCVAAAMPAKPAPMTSASEGLVVAMDTKQRFSGTCSTHERKLHRYQIVLLWYE